MELDFDIRGNLKPYEVIEINLEDFKKIFVDSFEEDYRRHEIFEKYLIYLRDFQEILKEDFFQWIGGSFTSNKINPRDIDLITVIHYKDYNKNLEVISKKFASRNARKLYEVDAYVVPDYPKDHKRSSFTKSDLVYWRRLFGQTRLNRAKKQYEKGFIQINFRTNE